MKRKGLRLLVAITHASLMFVALIGFLSGMLSRESATILVAVYAVSVVPVLVLQMKLQKNPTSGEIADLERLKAALRAKLEQKRRKHESR